MLIKINSVHLEASRDQTTQSVLFNYLVGRGLAQAVSRHLPSAETHILSRLVYVGFVADKEITGRVFLRVLFTLISVTPPLLNFYPHITDII